MLDFQIPDIPEAGEGGMPMNPEIAVERLSECLRIAASRGMSKGSVMPPWFSYWLEWEQKAQQTELVLGHAVTSGVPNTRSRDKTVDKARGLLYTIGDKP